MNRRNLALPALALLPVLAVIGGTAAHAATSSPQAPAPVTAAVVAGTTPAPGPVPGPGPVASTAPAASSRPQMRLDDTAARRDALTNAYNQCLLDHGAVSLADRTRARAVAVPGGADGTPLILAADPVPADAKAACADQLPLLPRETDASTNPRFHEQARDYVACLQEHGEWVRLLNDHDLDWTYRAGHSVPDDNGALEHDCLLAAFA